MGKITKGILGGFSGKVGTVVGSKIFGIDTMRSYQPNVENPRTIGQVTQRTKFSFIVQFLRLFLPIIQVGFSLKAIKQSAFNASVAYNIRNAVSGAHPDLVIDHAALLIAQGPLLKASNAAMDEHTDASVSISTSENCLETDTEFNDLAYGLFYNATKDSFLSSAGVLKRSDWSVNVVPTSWEVGDEVHGWIFYTSPGGSQVSDSVYAGSIALISA